MRGRRTTTRASRERRRTLLLYIIICDWQLHWSTTCPPVGSSNRTTGICRPGRLRDPVTPARGRPLHCTWQTGHARLSFYTTSECKLSSSWGWIFFVGFDARAPLREPKPTIRAFFLQHPQQRCKKYLHASTRQRLSVGMPANVALPAPRPDTPACRVTSVGGAAGCAARA